jgi:hypothetical protein
MRQGLWIVGILALLASLAGAQEAGVKLENKFVEGDTSVYEFTLNAKGTAIVKGVAAVGSVDLPMPLDLTAEGAVRCQVTAVHEDGSSESALTLDELSASATGFAQALSVDVSPDHVSVLYNNQEVAPAEAQEWVKKPLVVTQARNGQIVAVKGELLDALQQNPAFPAEWGRLVQQIAGLRPPFPEEPMFPGESLEQTSEIPFPGAAKPVKIVARFTFQGTETVDKIPCATIGVKAQATLTDYPFQLPLPIQPGVTLALTAQQVTGDLEMVLHFALEDAKLVHSEATVGWRATLTGPLPPPLGQGENITVEINLQETANGSLVP